MNIVNDLRNHVRARFFNCVLVFNRISYKAMLLPKGRRWRETETFHPLAYLLEQRDFQRIATALLSLWHCRMRRWRMRLHLVAPVGTT